MPGPGRSWPRAPGRYFETKAEAIAEVLKLRARGVRNIDVGCMQINLMYHPDAFTSLDAAFDPAQNVAYGANLLRSLRQSSGSWSQAVAQYHSQDDERGRGYMARVMRIWTSPAGRDAEPLVAAADSQAGIARRRQSRQPGRARRRGRRQGRRPMIRLDQRPSARPWSEVVRARTKFAEWLARRQAERRGEGPRPPRTPPETSPWPLPAASRAAAMFDP